MTIGIYRIHNIKNKKVYIGSSKNIERRFYSHRQNLKNNKHHSSKLQKSYNKTKDKTIFKFELIEETTEDKLFEREKYYIDFYDSFHNGYNCTDDTTNTKYVQLESRNKLYEEFILLYEEYKGSFIIGKKFSTRLFDKHYKKYVYKNMIEIINWFVENYDPTYYTGKINISNNRYYLTVGDKILEYNFVCYLWNKGKMYNSFHDTKMYYDNLKSDKNKHYIVDVPIYKF